MSDDSDRLKQLLDGDLAAEILENDPILAKLAERIYGEDFLEKMGLSRGESKRALSESLTDEDEELMIEVIPSDDSPLDLEPFAPPTAIVEVVQVPSKSKFKLVISMALSLLGTINLFGGLSFLGNSCTGGGCPSDGQTRLNWASLGNLDTGWGWSPSILEGSLGIPDIVILIVGFGGLLLIMMKR